MKTGGPKKSRRRRGPDGNLYTAEELTKVSESEETPTELLTLTVKTPEHVLREQDKKPAVEERSSKKEKESSPTVIISFIDKSGERRNKTFQCSSIKLDEYKATEMMNSGPKTTLHITLEADVVEVI